MQTEEIFIKAKEACRELAFISDNAKSEVLRALADDIVTYKDELLAANEMDLKRMDPDNPLYDRLLLTPERLDGIASDMRHVASLLPRQERSPTAFACTVSACRSASSA